MEEKILVTSIRATPVRPILKWAGGKTQLLPELHQRIPTSFHTYIEPFFGGGALFFSLAPKRAIIADSNPELINLYTSLAHDVERVISSLRTYTNTAERFYEVRRQNWKELNPPEAAARTIFLNKTCFNGLYRVNRKGEFNASFGAYKNPTLLDLDLLRSVSHALQQPAIICDDYLSVLDAYAKKGDLVFLDPPYIPIGGFADFKRYTKEQFGIERHAELAEKTRELVTKGCSVVVTNSNHPSVHELFKGFRIEVIATRRRISCHGDTRSCEDVIITSYAAVD